MTDFLASMAAASRERVRRAVEACPRGEMEGRARNAAAPPALRLSPARFDLIAELKLRSPALGSLRAPHKEDVAARVTDYARAGAAAVSVLTEPSRFDGSLEHLGEAACALAPTQVPTMRKDFLVDPYQAMEARVAGAGGVLVILRMLSRADLDALVECALDLGLFVLLEAFDEMDIALAHDIASRRAKGDGLLVGVNCRDLTSLQVVPGRLEALVSHLPTTLPRVAESGLETAADAARVAAAGYDLALVGGALMKVDAPQQLVRDMLAAGRSARACG